MASVGPYNIIALNKETTVKNVFIKLKVKNNMPNKKIKRIVTLKNSKNKLLTVSSRRNGKSKSDRNKRLEEKFYVDEIPEKDKDGIE